ncbi:class I SAM-dependent methyltransferase [Paracoccus pacificus]|uniref:Class I SAM-dependent methyltransferase n=1 Tax=Paracoccus pacificus TaxID=1463598 RepID=A0ABW4RC19_9RHOB
MAGSRLGLALEQAAGDERWGLYGPRGDADLSAFDPARTEVIQGFFPDYRALANAGFDVRTEPQTPHDAAIVFLPRARAEARARVAEAAGRLRPGAALWIDGQKTDGVDAMLRDLRGFVAVDQMDSRAHGRIFRVIVPDGAWLPADWAAAPIAAAPGFTTMPGMFSADAPDPASELLAAHLPAKLPSRIVDLGAGWGWLAAQALRHPGVTALHLVEADHAALECARRNITDPRAVFHWADARDFHLPEPVNGVIMNPPFHDGRAADPGLGRAFIQTAARLLTGAGTLWMVANRQLPYEQVLRECFRDSAEIAGDGRFKVLTATGAMSRRPAPKGKPPRRR